MLRNITSRLLVGSGSWSVEDSGWLLMPRHRLDGCLLVNRPPRGWHVCLSGWLMRNRLRRAWRGRRGWCRSGCRDGGGRQSNDCRACQFEVIGISGERCSARGFDAARVHVDEQSSARSVRPHDREDGGMIVGPENTGGVRGVRGIDSGSRKHQRTWQDRIGINVP